LNNADKENEAHKSLSIIMHQTQIRHFLLKIRGIFFHQVENFWEEKENGFSSQQQSKFKINKHHAYPVKSYQIGRMACNLPCK